MNIIQKKDQRKVLGVSCLIEVGERYVFYTIQALLIFYLIEELHLGGAYSDKLAGTAFGMVYVSALMGGYIAERLLSYYVAAFLGSLILIVGCAMMVSVHSENTLFLGLSLISIASGLIKSNVSSFIGKFYDEVHARESHRDFGFNIFYMGINIGIAASTFFATYLRNKYGFSETFFVSLAVAVVLSGVTLYGFFALKKYQSQQPIAILSYFKTFFVIAFYVSFVFLILKNPALANAMFGFIALLCVFVLAISAKDNQKNRVIAAVIFFVLSIVYWSLYMQLFISLLLFIDYAVHHQWLGLKMHTSQFVTIESLFVLLLGVVIGKIWIFFENKNRLIPDIDKFNLSFLMIGLMFFLIYLGIAFSSSFEKISPWFVIIGTFFMAASELGLSAIGLSMVTKVAPKGYVSMYMGIWLVTLGFGSKLAGEIASHIQIDKNVMMSKVAMSHGLLWFMVIAGFGMLLSFLMRKKTLLN